MLRRSSPLSHTLMSTELLMTTARPTSRRQRHKIPTVLLLVASWLLFLTAESRPPPTPLTTSTDSSLMSHTREPQSTHQSQRRDTDTPPLTRPPPQLTTPKLPSSLLLRNQWSPKSKTKVTYTLVIISTKKDCFTRKCFAGFQNISLPIPYLSLLYPCPVNYFLFISYLLLFIYWNKTEWT